MDGNIFLLALLRDGFIFACINSSTSFVAGFVIVAVLGFMAGKQGVAVGEVAKGGRY